MIWILILITMAIGGLVMLQIIAYLEIRKIRFQEPTVNLISTFKNKSWDEVMTVPRDFLTSRGFSLSGFLKIEEEKGLMNFQNLAEVWYNEEDSTFVTLQIHPQPEAHFPWRSSIYNLMSWGELRITTNEIYADCFPYSNHESVNVYGGLSWKSFVESHLNFMIDVKNKEGPIQCDLKSFANVLREVMKDRFFKLLDSNQLFSRDDKVFSFRLLPAFFYVQKILRKNKRLVQERKEEKKAIHPQELPGNILKISLDSFGKKKQFFDKFNGIYKYALVLSLLVLLLREFGTEDLWVTGVLVLCVIAIHEIGLKLGEKYFSRKMNKGLREGLVLLSGLFPGLFLSFLLKVFVSDDWWQFTSISEFILISLFFNSINLLPFRPFDGGRLMGLILNHQAPKVGNFLFIIGAVGMAFLALVWEFPVLFLIALGMLINFNFEKKINQASMEINKKFHEGESLERLLYLMIAKIPTEIAFFQKWFFYKELKERVKFYQINWKINAGLFVCYLFALSLPVFSEVLIEKEEPNLKKAEQAAELREEDNEINYVELYQKTCQDEGVVQMQWSEEHDRVNIQIYFVDRLDSLRLSEHWRKDSLHIVHWIGPVWELGELLPESLAEINRDVFGKRSQDQSLWAKTKKRLEKIREEEDSIWFAMSQEEQTKWLIKNKPTYKNYLNSCIDKKSRAVSL